LMKQGYELGFSQGLWPRAWLQLGGLGKGGKMEDVHLSTFLSLRQRKVIELVYEGWARSEY